MSIRSSRSGTRKICCDVVQASAMGTDYRTNVLVRCNRRAETSMQPQQFSHRQLRARSQNQALVLRWYVKLSGLAEAEVQAN